MRTYHGRPLSRATLSVILRNPIYVMADPVSYTHLRGVEPQAQDWFHQQTGRI